MNKYLFLFLFSLFIAACDEPEIDIDTPEITIHNISPNATSGVVCGTMESNVIYTQSMDSIVINVTFADNQALSQYKIDIHNNFDCHGHRGPMTSNWNLQKIETINGKQVTIREVLTVPDDVTAGSYHCSIQLLDESGNQSPTIFYTLNVQNRRDTVPPTITLTQPITPTITVSNGNSIVVQGNLMDNSNLEHGKIELVYFTPSGNKSTAETLHLTANAGNNYAYTFNYTIPQSLVSGNYDFEVRAYDGVGNVANDLDFEVIIQ